MILPTQLFKSLLYYTHTYTYIFKHYTLTQFHYQKKNKKKGF